MTAKMKGKKQKRSISTFKNQQVTTENNETVGSASSTLKSTTRIRNPGPSDVLCGRGGGINAHIGNVAFRELVQVKKERYNLAANKQEKAEISQDIVDHVKKRGGRFLQKDDSRPYTANSPNTGWWVEIDDIRAIAKTSQALREGAPRIRAKAAKQTLRKSLGKRGRQSFVSTSASDSEDSASPPAQENEEPAEKEEVLHPIIRGYQDGVHRGKRLIPVFSSTSSPPTPPPPEKKTRLEPPQSPIESHAPTPPLLVTTSSQTQRSIETPTLLSTSSHAVHDTDEVVSSHQNDAPALHELDSDGFPQPMPLFPSIGPAGFPSQPRLDSLSIMNPASSSFAEIVKPDIRCARMHSLAMSEISSGDDFRGDESFSNPFENEEKLFRPQVSASAVDIDLDTSGPSVSSINRILKAKSSDSVTNHSNIMNNSSISSHNNNSNSMKSASPNKDNTNKSKRIQSLRSFMSDLSDIPDAQDEEDEDFHEGLKNIYDAVYPGFTCPINGEPLSSHWMPINLLK